MNEKSAKALGIEGSDTEPILLIERLVVANINKDDVMFDLPRKFTRNAIPADRCEIPGSPVIRKMAHLKNISTEITCYMADDEVGMLIRQNCTNTLRPREIIYGEESDPNAVRSLLGWYVNGPLCTLQQIGKITCKRINGGRKGNLTTPREYVLSQ